MTGAPPFLVFVLGALALPLLGSRWRPAWTLLVPLAGLVNLLLLDPGVHWRVGLFDYELILGRIDKLSFLFALLFHVAAALGAMFALHERDSWQQVSALLYAGGALGAVFAGDLLTLFVFWEIMAVASVFLIWARRQPRATRAGTRYLIAQIASGVLLLAGAMAHYAETGSLAFAALSLDGAGAKLIFLAFGIKCAWPFLHAWLTDGLSRSDADRNGVSQRLHHQDRGVCAGARVRGHRTPDLDRRGDGHVPDFLRRHRERSAPRPRLQPDQPGRLHGRRHRARHGARADGAVSHAFNDVVFKGLLFMTMGAVLHMTGRIDGSDLGGLYKTMPWTTTFCLIGAASISAFPLFSGFVSKSMVMAAAAGEGYVVVFLCLLFASAGVFHHAGIKIPYFAFFAHDSGIRAADPPFKHAAGHGACRGDLRVQRRLAVVALRSAALAGGLCALHGDACHYAAPAAVFLGARVCAADDFRRLSAGTQAPESGRRLAAAPPGTQARRACGTRRMGAWTGGARAVSSVALRLWRPVRRAHAPQGILSRSWASGVSAMWVAGFLALSLLLLYLREAG